MDCSTPGSSVLHYLPEFAQTHAHWVSDANHLIFCHHLLLYPQSFPPSRSFPMSQPFASDGQSIGASASVLPRILRTDFLYDWLVWSPCSPRDSQESSPTPQFKSINSLALRLLYDPTLTSMHDYGVCTQNYINNCCKVGMKRDECPSGDSWLCSLGLWKSNRKRRISVWLWSYFPGLEPEYKSGD